MSRRVALYAAMIGSSAVVAPGTCFAATPSVDTARVQGATPVATGQGAVDWRDIPRASGTWVYREDKRGSLALYGEPDSEALFLVRCNRANRRIYFSRAGQIANGTGSMAFTATHGGQSYTAQNSSGATPYIVAATGATDAYLDTIAFSRGSIAVTVTGQSMIVIPTWPEMTRIFEDCRG